MSLRAKADEVVAEGEAKRGIRKPEGAPKKVYDYWLHNSNSSKARAIRNGTRKENFCHYWRVVLFGALLMSVGHFLDKNFEYFAAGLMALLVGGAIVAAIVSGDFWAIAIGVTAFMAFCAANIFGGVSAANILHKDRSLNEWPAWAKWVLVVVGPIGAAIVTLFWGIKDIAQSSLVSGFYYAHTGKIWIGIGLGTLATILGLTALWGGLGAFGVLAAILLGAAVIVTLGFYLAPYIGDYVETKREEDEAKVDAYYEEHGHFPVHEPGKLEMLLRKFFRGVGDFVIFAAQVIRVRKWGICPIMDVNAEEQQVA